MNNKDEIIAKLKKENEYLKNILRIHNISFEAPKEIKQFSFSNDEKIKIYLSCFVGGDDIFAYEFYSKEGKLYKQYLLKGYVINEDRLALKDARIDFKSRLPKSCQNSFRYWK